MPRPTISGTVIRRIDMNHTSHSKDKDYRITVTQEPDGLCRVYTEHGPAGKLLNGKERTRRPAFVVSALAMADNIRNAKIKQPDSYDIVSDRRFSATATPSDKPAPVQPAPQAPVRKLISIDSLSPVSRAALAAIF